MGSDPLDLPVEVDGIVPAAPRFALTLNSWICVFAADEEMNELKIVSQQISEGTANEPLWDDDDTR
jgi:hypothetical protein